VTDQMEYKPFDHAYHTMQRELVHIFQQRVCWADKEQVAYALERVRADYESLERERRGFDSAETDEKGLPADVDK